MAGGNAVAPMTMQEAQQTTTEALHDLLASVADWWVRCILVLGPSPVGANDMRQILAVYPDDYRTEARSLARSEIFGPAWRRSESPMAAWHNFGDGDRADSDWASPWLSRGVRSMVRVDIPTALNNGFEFFALAARDVRGRGDAAQLAWAVWGVWPRIRSDVIARGYGVSAREREVLALLAQGATAQGAADQLGCTARTITYHLTNVARKLGAVNKAGAVQRACTLGLL